MAPRYASDALSPAPLAQPLHFTRSGKTAKNRFIKSPMAEWISSWSPTKLEERGIVTDELIEAYRSWGEGANSWGVLVTGNINIDFQQINGVATPIITPECPPEGLRFEKAKELATKAKADGSLIVGQVVHPGRQMDARCGSESISASAVPLENSVMMKGPPPREATKADLARVVEGYAHAADFLYKAGFDGIEIHAAHGYLISQFLSRTTNKRTDEYGPQTIESRLRLVTEIVDAIKARVPSEFIIAAKLNSVEFQEGGVTVDESRELCELLEAMGLDFVTLSGGTYEDFGLRHEKESTRRREAFFIEFAENITKAIGQDRKMKVYIAGGLRSVGAMVKALEVVDGVAIGRPATAEPHLASDIIEGRVTGAVKPTDDVENVFFLGLSLAATQIGQIGNGLEPLDASDPAVVEIFSKDMDVWAEKLAADGDKLEYVSSVEYSGPTKPARKIAAA